MKINYITNIITVAALLVGANSYGIGTLPFSTWQIWEFENATLKDDGFVYSSPEMLNALDGAGDPVNSADGFDTDPFLLGITDSFFRMNDPNSSINISPGGGVLELAPTNPDPLTPGALLFIENWIDSEPVKNMEISIFGSGFGTGSGNLELQFVSAFDSDTGEFIIFDSGNPEITSQITFDNMFMMNATIRPNPDYEILRIVNIGSAPIFIDRIEVHTESTSEIEIPEPSTYSMLGLCLGLLGVARSRKQLV